MICLRPCDVKSSAQSEENLDNKLNRYRAALDPLPVTHNAWPLHGAGLPNLGRGHAMTVSPRPDPGPEPDPGA